MTRRAVLPLTADQAHCDWCTAAPDELPAEWSVILLAATVRFGADGSEPQEQSAGRITCPACAPLVNDRDWPTLADRAISAQLARGRKPPAHARSEVLSLFLSLAGSLTTPVPVLIVATPAA